MNTLSSLALIVTLFMLAAAVPGPNWVVITRQAIAGGRRSAVSTALGVATGSTAWMLMGMTGAAAAMARWPALSTALRLAGATYLVGSSIVAWRNSSHLSGESTAGPHAGRRQARPFVTGLLTSLTNPKSALFWTSVFTSTLPASPSMGLYAAVALLVPSIAALWYVGLALAFSASPLRPVVDRFRVSLQRAAALVQIGLGLRLVMSVTRSMPG
jgi:threonine/homoserine/homoserine lactone efflux protein